MLQRRQPGAEDARLVQHLKRALVAGDVKLVPRAAFESASPVGSDLRRDAERAQKAEGTARDRGMGDVEVDGNLSASFEVNAARGMKEARQLRQTIALASRRNRRELVPEIFRE